MKYMLAIILILTAAVTFALPTTVTVRVRAKDAKFIGTGIGGAYVVIKNKLTGEVLAKGLTQGNSGDTPKMLQLPQRRYQNLTDSATAKFVAEIDIDDPVFVVIEVTVPMTSPQASVKASVEHWLIPNKDIKGEGIVIEVPGMIVDISKPTVHQIIKLDSLPGGNFSFKANVTMLCGCTTTKGGIWNADSINVSSIFKIDGVKRISKYLTPTGVPNEFEATIRPDRKGLYELTIFAFDPRTFNTGVDKISFVIE